MSDEILPVLPGRPATIKKDGWTFFISIHDKQALLERREWKQKIAAAHPDKGGTSDAFRRVLWLYSIWVRNQLRYYRQLGLMPPFNVRPELLEKVEQEPQIAEPHVCWCGRSIGQKTGQSCSAPCANTKRNADRLGISPQDFLELRRLHLLPSQRGNGS